MGGDTGISRSVTLEIVNSNLAGDIHVDNLSITKVSLFSTALTANSTISDTLENAGAIKFAADAGQGLTSLTVGNYKGVDGALVLRTTLGNDSSDTDMLFVKHHTSGSTNIKIINPNGTGALTNDGIKIIDVSGMSLGKFSLLRDYVFEGDQAVVGGAYAYRLYQNSISDPNDGHWYLRSSITPNAPEVTDRPKEQTVPQKPLYQPGVPAYESYPQALLGLNGLNTLQQRVGNRFWSGAGNRGVSQGADTIQYYAPAKEAGVHNDDNGIWGRIEDAHNKLDPKFSSSGTDYSQNVFRMQAGADMVLTEEAGGKLIGGVFAHYVHGKTKVSSIYDNSMISSDGYGFGGTLTWYGNEGFYVDGQAQTTWYNSDLSSTPTHKSLVSGKRFAITSQWSVTPQAQLVYSNVSFDSFNDVWGGSCQPRQGQQPSRSAWYDARLRTH